EPMINQGEYDIFVDADNDWTAITEDGSYSSQWEHTVLVTEDGVEIIAY
ncbi:MAG: methionine aminopeptidase, partial [Clostridium sp.]